MEIRVENSGEFAYLIEEFANIGVVKDKIPVNKQIAIFLIIFYS